MSEPIALLNGEFLPADELKIAADDLGFLQGVTISERLRTFGGRLFRWDDHIARLQKSLRTIELELPVAPAHLGRLVDQLLARNRSHAGAHGDLGVSMFVTPGRVGRNACTWAAEVYRLPFEQWVSWYDQGQALVETGIRQVPASCWPPSLKCRCRMHYYLADQRAARQCPGARAILLDQDERVTEASTANVIAYHRDRGLVSPPLERILPGVSLAVIRQLAAELGLAFSYADLRLADLAAADEVLLCSTSPCVWPATRLNDRPIGTGTPGPVWQRLCAAWSDLVGLDIVGQARSAG